MNERILEIYTDASIRGTKKKGGIKKGFGILFIKPNESEVQFAYKINYKLYYSELSIPFNERKRTYLVSDELEMFAFYVSIKKLIESDIKYDKVHLYVDEESVYNYFNNINKTKTGIIKQIRNKGKLELLEKTKKIIKKHNIDIEVRQIKGHTKIYGNEIADMLASAGGRTPRCMYNSKYDGKYIRVEYKNNHREYFKN